MGIQGEGEGRSPKVVKVKAYGKNICTNERYIF